MSQAAVPRITFAEYIKAEEAAETKSEYFDGQVFAMSGGTAAHALLGARLITEIGAALKGGPCRVYSSDLRIRVVETGLATYPDLSVVCGPISFDPNDKNTVTNPAALFEVLSDSTEAYDRGKKFSNYRRIPSLKLYVLVSQNEPLVEVFRRGDDGRWSIEEVSAEGTAKLEAIGCSLSVQELYAGVFDA